MKQLRVGVTGHIAMTPATQSMVRNAMTRLLMDLTVGGRPPRGLSCLADGTDQLFVEALASLGGTYDLIIPSQDFRTQMRTPDSRSRYDRLLAGAAQACTLDYATGCREAYAEATEDVILLSDHLVAVWDGTSSRRLGDTAWGVDRARLRGVPVTVVWPAGAQRARNVSRAEYHSREAS